MSVAAQARAADSDGTRFEPAADGAFDAGEAVGEGGHQDLIRVRQIGRNALAMQDRLSGLTFQQENCSVF